MTAALRASSTSSSDQTENIKDTIESLVIAFILAFVFRGFLVEAFVIPTGSMAPSLMGMHGTQLCPDCGWEYAYGMPETNMEREKIKCPNCGRESASRDEIPYHAPSYRRNPQELLSGAGTMDQQAIERLNNLEYMPKSGDRILVFKWPFDLGGSRLGPQPWDVVVFKNPSNGEDNYIKRLIGMPNEVLEIVDGDIYYCPVSELEPEAVESLNRMIELKHALHHGQSKSIGRDYQELLQLRQETSQAIRSKLRIRRKAEIAQKSLWHVVFHQDYLPPPSVPLKSRPRWEAVNISEGAGGWDASTPQIKFLGLDAPPQTLAFKGKPIRDFYSYNFDPDIPDRSEDVWDVRMKFVVQYHEGSGLLRLELGKEEDLFAAELSPTGQIFLKHRQRSAVGSEQVLQAGRMVEWKAGRPFQVEFGNLDYQVYLKINDELVLATTDADYSPDLLSQGGGGRGSYNRDFPQITADHLNLELWQLALDRDVYYRVSYVQDDLGWGTEGNPIYLREGEYFVLGDNSPASQDSRAWSVVGPHLRHRGVDYQLGTVSDDQMIGKAFFVYWPSGYRIKWLPVFRDFGFIPNVGKMRWIR